MAGILHEERTLEQKILDAMRLGLKFNLVPAGHAFPPVPADTMNVSTNWTDAEFEQQLKDAIARFKNSEYLSILKKHNLV